MPDVMGNSGTRKALFFIDLYGLDVTDITPMCEFLES
jgi:hypothetical protein